MKKIMSLGILLVAIACVDKQPDGIDVMTVNVKVSNEYIDNPFPYSHYILLDTPDNVLLGEIEKLQIIGDNIYVMDNQRRSVFCFDLQGKYLHHLTRDGRSDKEYIRIEDFEVNPDKTIYIFDSFQKKIVMYDSLGNFMNSMPTINGAAFKLLSDGLVAYNRGNGAASIDKDDDQQLYNYACTRGREIEINAVPFDEILEGRRLFLGQTKNCFNEWDREIFMSSMFNDTIFRISRHNGHIEPYIVFNMENKERTNMQGAELLNFTDNIMNGIVASSPYEFHKNGDLMMVMYNYDQHPHTFIYDKKTGMSVNGMMSFNKYGLPFSPVSYLDSDNSGKIITLLKPYNIQRFLDLGKKKSLDTSILEELQQKTNEEDNTILIVNNWPESLLRPN